MAETRRHPLIVMENLRRFTKAGAKEVDLAPYIRSEGYSPEEISSFPVPRNLPHIATVVKVGSVIGKPLSNSPGIAGEIARNPEFAEAIAPFAGQITGNITGFATGGPLVSKALGTVGATAGESFSQAIKFMRGENVSPEKAMKEVLHTGIIAGISEAAFGAGSPGAKLISGAFGKLASLRKGGTPVDALVARIGNITT